MSLAREPRQAVTSSAIEFSDHPTTVILQPTPLCNMRCTYCYLPDVSDRRRMDPALVAKLARDLASTPPDHCTEVRWHAGEPLTVGIDYFTRLLQPLEVLRGAGRVRHSLQTNATLVNARWCELFRDYGVDVGVSIDGPREFNRRRVTLSRAETFDRTRRGIECLREHGIPFTIISVVSVDDMQDIAARAGDYLRFFESTGAHVVGFNVEETEGHHEVEGAEEATTTVRTFWEGLFRAWVDAGCQPRVREFVGILSFARTSLNGWRGEAPVDLLPTVTCDGDVVVLSPELAGFRNDRYADFKVGNLNERSLQEILRDSSSAAYVQEFLEGAGNCRDTCRYFAYCRAGQASNRYFEHGDFVTSETEFCRRMRQVPFDVVLGSPGESLNVGSDDG